MDASGVPAEFLDSTDVVDWFHQDVRAQAWLLAAGATESGWGIAPERDALGRCPSHPQWEVARRCFEWVRDEVAHSVDFGRAEVTCKASAVLAHRTGLCYAKSHLLAALLRANGIPAGFCYQRLSIDGHGEPFSLHGLNAVWLPEHGWYRVDARGNKPGVEAQFTPPVERLAFPVQHPGETDLPEIWPEPLPVVTAALERHTSVDALCKNLPDVLLALCAVT